ncbi:MAG TPA: response regulator transcription factor [Polyangiaceae bacterium]|nr:response regulator transcription factor [Polyangiaceae bacterium]
MLVASDPPTKSAKVLVVEDNPKVARFLRRLLSDEGLVADGCADGDEAVRQVKDGRYDLVLLDWMLPGQDGLSVCRELRRSGSKVPVLMLTARSELRERVLGLKSGADDYVVKPFEVEELVARIHALLRRTQGARQVNLGGMEIDLERRCVVIDARPVFVTGRELDLLLHLANRVNEVVTRAELLARIWQMPFDPGSNVVDVQVRRLREKLGTRAWMVETVRGVGYRLRSESS